MGYACIDFSAPHEIFDEHARLSAHRNDAGNGHIEDHVPRVFNLGGLVGLGGERYDALQPIQGPGTA